MDNKQPSVCVLGAGLSGLCSIKCMVDAGFSVKCFDKNKALGGRWNGNNENAIPRSTVTNLTKLLMSFSDFPMPNDFPLYLTADKFCEYLYLYAENFYLEKYISFSCEVLSVKPLDHEIKASGDDESGEEHFLNETFQWVVTYKVDEEIFHEQFDFVVVSTGFYSHPFIPKKVETALVNFKGKIIHSMNYKGWEEFKNENVVVIGLGNTGGDIVSELADHTRQTYIATSSGAHVLGRISKGGIIPANKGRSRIIPYLPSFLMPILLPLTIRKLSYCIYNLDALCLTPNSYLNVIVNDEICIRIASGKIKVKPGIERCVNRAVYFTNGTSADNVDTIVLSTGYQRKFLFLGDLIKLEKNGKCIPLYKGIFYPEYKEKLAFIGMFGSTGPIIPSLELQARYTAEVLKGNISLPSVMKMKEIIQDLQKTQEHLYGSRLKEYNATMNPWAYSKELADDIGCSISVIQLLFTDPKLAWQLLGRYCPFEYRLIGPNRWSGARDAILSMASQEMAFMNGSRNFTDP